MNRVSATELYFQFEKDIVIFFLFNFYGIDFNLHSITRHDGSLKLLPKPIGVFLKILDGDEKLKVPINVLQPFPKDGLVSINYPQMEGRIANQEGTMVDFKEESDYRFEYKISIEQTPLRAIYKLQNKFSDTIRKKITFTDCVDGLESGTNH